LAGTICQVLVKGREGDRKLKHAHHDQFIFWNIISKQFSALRNVILTLWTRKYFRSS